LTLDPDLGPIIAHKLTEEDIQVACCGRKLMGCGVGRQLHIDNAITAPAARGCCELQCEGRCEASWRRRPRRPSVCRGDMGDR